MNNKSEIEIYQSSDGQTEIIVRFDGETVWLNKEQLGALFNRDRTVIGRHIKNIFEEGELIEEVVCADFASTTPHGAIKGKTQVKYAKYYNLDVIISVGYRVKSINGTQFRQWASKRLKEYLITGFTINEKRLEQKNQEVQFLRSGIQIMSRLIEHRITENENEWLAQFSRGLTLLDDYDHERLDETGLTLGIVNYPTLQDYLSLIFQMKQDFESNIFGIKKDQSFESAIAQISKGYDNDDFYPSIEEKAATLLYLIIKNHAFTDGNKRIAAACFLLFLDKNNCLINLNGTPIISNEALASITLFAAASKPNEMDIIKKLIVSILNRNKNQ